MINALAFMLTGVTAAWVHIQPFAVGTGIPLRTDALVTPRPVETRAIVPAGITPAIVQVMLARLPEEPFLANACVIGHQVNTSATIAASRRQHGAFVDVDLASGTSKSDWTDTGVAIESVDAHGVVVARLSITPPVSSLAVDAAVAGSAETPVADVGGDTGSSVPAGITVAVADPV